MENEGFIDSRIKPQLVEALGRHVANSLFTRATLVYVSTDGTEQERYEAFLQTVCSDERVKAVWGEEATAEQLKAWRLQFTVHKARMAMQDQKGGPMTAEILDGRAMAKEARKEIVAEVADFKAKYKPHLRRLPFFLEADTISWAAGTVWARGFSHRTCRPISSAAAEMGACRLGGVHTRTTSDPWHSTASRQSVVADAP